MPNSIVSLIKYTQYKYHEQAGLEYLADILDPHVSRQSHAKHFRTST